MVNKTNIKTLERLYYPLISVKERLLIWEKARGMWKHRKPNPAVELKKIKREWERKLPLLNK